MVVGFIPFFPPTQQPCKKKAFKAEDTPAQVQFRAWFGPTDSFERWPFPHDKIVMLSELFENERKMLKWGVPKLPRDRSHWSNALGKRRAAIDPSKRWLGWSLLLVLAPQINVSSLFICIGCSEQNVTGVLVCRSFLTLKLLPMHSHNVVQSTIDIDGFTSSVESV